ncbi:MAG: ceramidase domain-containing protein [Terriglobales bacterium]
MHIGLRWFRLLERRTRLGLTIAVSLLSLIALWFAPRVPLRPGYHDFTDQRPFLGIPNCFDVLSNIPFVVVGILGLVWLSRRSSDTSFIERRERLPYFVFFAGVALTGLGSSWYHLAPSNSRLSWDLLPMSCCFMSIVAALIMERISLSAGFRLLIPLLALGIASVLYWYLTEMQGHGDYRFYMFVQLFPPILLATIIVLFPPRYTGTKYLAVAFILFVAAKLLELIDRQVYSVTGFVSGHSLKHLTAGLSCYWILRMLQCRRPIQDAREYSATNPLGVYERQSVS